MWNSFLQFRYHNIKLKVFHSDGEASNSNDSIWWRDVISNDITTDAHEEGFSMCVHCKVKKGNSILFWHSIWLGNQSIHFTFPNLFDLSTNKLYTVAELVVWENGNQSWNLVQLFGSVFNPVQGTAGGSMLVQWQLLQEMLLSVSLDPAAEDSFVWQQKLDGDFMVVSVTDLISEQKESAWHPAIIRRLKITWKMNIPLKIRVFAWVMFISKLPSKDLLARRGMSNNSFNLNCVLCESHEESLNHLFFLCQTSKAVWEKIYMWLGDNINFSLEEFMCFDVIQEKVRNISTRDIVNIIWLATLWSLWLMRNVIVFDNASYSFEAVYTNVMFFSWRWLACSNNSSRSSFCDWYKLPLSCFISM
ncbi:uncharacterized protein LOC131605705 [Vicia villosa]|uniref:uncharacterized protein LOC131605705 n=1 Tax=Vicia villosa TaxID=3911 RepID=UPI00273B5E03|nr:uncharacterized protein LOC131605705 [Vicia villosa]